MEIFADTADPTKLLSLQKVGIIDGATTNPSLIAQYAKASGISVTELYGKILSSVNGPVSLEVTETSPEGMIEQGRNLAKLGDNVLVKLPLNLDGLTACRQLASENIRSNVTLCFSLQQAVLAAKAGAAYVSPFVGRLDDIGLDGIELIENIRLAFDNYQFATKILVASVRNFEHVRRAMLIGADAITCPPEVIEQIIDHPLTKKGLEKFLSDYKTI